jgi:vancomycin aglycone glucosyltransferase
MYVGFGSMPMHASTDVAEVAIEAIRAHGRRAAIARGWANLALIDDADDCFAIGEVNQQALFSRVAAVVHHGGAGTTTTVVRAGASQVVVPQAADLPYWAGRVADVGIGAALTVRTRRPSPCRPRLRQPSPPRRPASEAAFDLPDREMPLST